MMRLNPTKEILKHRSLIVAMVVTKRILVKVVLQVLGTHVPIHIRDAAFDISPKAVNGLGVNIAVNVKPLPVQYFFVGVSHLGKVVVDKEFVSMNARAFLNVVFDNWQYGFAFHVGNSNRLDSTFSFNHTKDRDFVFRTATASPALATTEI